MNSRCVNLSNKSSSHFFEAEQWASWKYPSRFPLNLFVSGRINCVPYTKRIPLQSGLNFKPSIS